MPPMTTPFDKNGEIVYSAIADQVEFMIRSGVHGLVAGGSTGEGHTLATDEYVKVMETTVAAADGRVPVVAGLIVNSTREAITRIAMLKHLSLAALQVTPVHYLFKPDDDATVRHFREIYDACGTPILIYNVIPWNYLSPALMVRIMDEVPGVIGIKQSGGDLKSVSDLLLMANPRNLIFSATDALLYCAYAIGARGSISAVDSCVPSVTVKLWNAVQAGDHATALKIHRGLAALWNSLKHDNLPACTKYVQHLQGLPMFYSRAPMQPVPEAAKASIKQALEALPI